MSEDRSENLKITVADYFICQGMCRTELEGRVVEKCKAGWVPIGGVMVSVDHYLLQAVVKYAE